MTDELEDDELRNLIEGLKIDAREYFAKARKSLDHKPDDLRPWNPRRDLSRDYYWEKLPEELRGEAQRLNSRLVSFMGQVARSVRNAPLLSEADQRDVTTGTKAMRAAILLRDFRSWNTQILNDEDVVLGVTPPGQSDDKPADPAYAERIFVEWIDKISAITDLIAASPSMLSTDGAVRKETARYRPSTAFIMMWMDKTKSDLIDVVDTVKEVFSSFGIMAIRADDIEHEGLITSRVLDEIQTAEFCFADLSGNRPNVYYEVGYAHALHRRVILFRKAGTGLHFDLAGYNCPEYQNLRDLKEQLSKRLRALTNKEPKN